MSKPNDPNEILYKHTKERQTTMPILESPEPGQQPAFDPRRTPAGPPAGPISQFLTLLFGLTKMGLCLVFALTDTQRSEDAAAFFTGAMVYIRRVGLAMTLFPDYFKAIPFQGADLYARFDRIEQLEVAVERATAVLQQLKDTLTVERADAIRMADIAIAEIESDQAKLTLNRLDRKQLDDVAGPAQAVWRQRIDLANQSRLDNAKLTAAADAAATDAREQAAAAAARNAVLTGEPVLDEEALLAAGYVKTPATPGTRHQPRTPPKKPGKPLARRKSNNVL